MPGTRKLGRPTAHRLSMLRGLVTFLLEKGSIETTVAKAKEVRSLTDRMITLGKENTLHSRRQALSFITKEDTVKKLFDEIAPKYEERNGGYTQIFRLGPRRGDAAEMAIIKLMEQPEAKKPEDTKPEGKKPKAKKPEAKKTETRKPKAKKSEKTEE